MILDIAREYIGVKGGSVEHKRIIDKYNTLNPLPRGYRMKYNDNWCMAFMSFCAMETGLGRDQFAYECGCHRAYVEKVGEYVDKNNLAVGDLIFFSYNRSWISHVGVVERITDSSVHTIEGNSNNQVRRNVWAKTNTAIYGYKRFATVTQSDIDYDKIVREVISGIWGNEPYRRQRIESAGYDYEKVKEMVNAWYKEKNLVSEEEATTVAYDVCKGKWGNMPEREILLTHAGYNYEQIRKIVNKLKEEGKA